MASPYMIAAFALDRAEQYDHGSGIYHAMTTLAHQFLDCEHIESHAHGELDDLIKRLKKQKAKEETNG